MELVAAIIGAILGGLLTVILPDAMQKRRTRRRLIETLKTELVANLSVVERALSSNRALLDTLTAEQRGNPQFEILDETTFYVAPLIDSSLALWLEAQAEGAIVSFPSQEFLNYKLALAKTNHLVDRFKGFRYRVHFFSALLSDHEALRLAITTLQSHAAIRSA